MDDLDRSRGHRPRYCRRRERHVKALAEFTITGRDRRLLHRLGNTSIHVDFATPMAT